MLSPSAVVSSITTKIERFRKLYRILYRDFLVFDFVHKDDVMRMNQELHQRITLLEANMNANFTALTASTNAAIIGHTHLVPQSPAGTNPSLPGIPVTPVVPPVLSSTPIIPWAEPQTINKLNLLIAEGPALAPLATGTFDIQAAEANATILTDIGV